MKKRFARRMALLLMVALLMPLCTACAPRLSPESTLSVYFDAMNRRDYSRCYACLDEQTRQSLTLSEFVSRYNAIYDAMGMQYMTYALGEGTLEGETYVFPCVLTYDCQDLGTFDQNVTITMTAQDQDWAIRWSPAMILTDLDWGDEVRVRTLKQNRGEILDANGNAFAINSYALTVCVDLEEIGDYATCARQLAAFLGMKEEDIQKILNSERSQKERVAQITHFVPGTLDDNLRLDLLGVQGVFIDTDTYTPIRYYPQGSMLAHTLGYTSVITAEDLETLDVNIYGVDSQVGRSGLEAAYEEMMVGKPGKELFIRTPTVVDELTGEPLDYLRKATVVRIDPVDGYDLELTIDFRLQQRAENALASLGEDRAGCAIVLDPSTGAVLASASYPSYSNNIFADRNVSALYQAVLDQPRSALYNRVTLGRYPPGSTVKPFMAAMALENGSFSMDTLFTGQIYRRQWTPKVTGWVYPPITRVSDYAQPYDMRNAIIHSDNIYFANVSLTNGWRNVVGMYERLGFNTAISYDIGVAQASIYNDDSQSNLRLLADTGYGQGELLITPLQMACVFSAFANGGNIMQPYIVGALKYTDEDGRFRTAASTEPTVWRSGLLSQEIIDQIQPVLIDTVKNNSRMAMRSLTFAGKTGTAQLDGNNEREIAWAIVYVTNTDYQRLICVCLELEANNSGSRYDVLVPLMMP